MNQNNKYWNPYLETLDREALRGLQLRKFKRLLNWAFQNSSYYRDLYREAGIEPGDVNTWEDVRRVPKVDKARLKEAQEGEPFPYGGRLCVPLAEVSEFRQTSGTTGTPVYQADTWQDWEWWSEAWSYILWAQGYRATDRVFIPFGYNIFVAFWAGHYAAEKLGCEVVPGGVLDTASRVLKIKELAATAMMGTPTYILNMASVARERLRLDGSACWTCKSKVKPRVHHIDPVDMKRIIAVIREELLVGPEKLATYCSEHHKEIHKGE